MPRSTKLAPPNSLLLVSDVDGGECPEITRGSRIWSNPSCIAIGCLAFMDGKTEVTLGSVSEIGVVGAATFSGLLQTPNREVTVSTVEGDSILALPVRSAITNVHVWTNHPREPDRVVIGVE